MPPFSTPHRRGGRADRQRQAGRRDGSLREAEMLALLASGRSGRRATRSRRPRRPEARRSPPTRRACRSCARWSRSSACDVGGRPTCGHVQDNAEESVRRVITRAEGRRSSTLPLDNGAHDPGAITRRTPIAAQRRRSTSPAPRAQLPNNFNAPKRGLTMAAVLYVFRTLVDDDIPLNAGCLKPLQVIIPDGSHAESAPAGSRWWPATSRPRPCITNALYGALRRDGGEPVHDEQLHLRQRDATSTTRRSRAAPGAGPRFRRHASVVQTHMTNSRLTDPEVLEFRFPVRLDELRDPQRLGRRGAAPRRRRRRAARALPRGDDGVDPVATGAACASFGLAGGAPGSVGHQPRRARRRPRRDAAPHRLGADASRATCS